MQYEAWIEKGMTNRIITIEAVGVREAFRLADEQCEDDEFVRGVNAAPSPDGFQHGYHA